MDPVTRDQVLGYLADMKRLAKTNGDRARADQLAVGIITMDSRPLVMAHGLHAWLGLTQPLAPIEMEG